MLHEVFHSGAPLRLHCDHRLDDLEDLVGVVRRYAVNLTKLDLIGQLNLIGRFEWSSQSQHLVDDTTSGPDVRFFVITLLLDLLGTHVVWSANVRIRED